MLDADAPNHVELFQIWLNLPKKDKLVEPYFTMLWDRDIPRVEQPGVEITVVAGALDGKRPPAPPPNSWAARPESDVAIWCVRMKAGAKWTMPRAASDETVRVIYFFAGPELRVGDHVAKDHAGLVVASDQAIEIEAGDGEVEMLVLQGRPIGEPVVAHGPFVMNSRVEIEQAFADYRRTHFGGWPWPSDDPVHGRDERFAKHADGRVERAVR
ncbi:MAG TPA: pirin-like C-terminal cupin domain-containing protein [Polyangiaceae bacterium]